MATLVTLVEWIVEQRMLNLFLAVQCHLKKGVFLNKIVMASYCGTKQNSCQMYCNSYSKTFRGLMSKLNSWQPTQWRYNCTAGLLPCSMAVCPQASPLGGFGIFATKDFLPGDEDSVVEKFQFLLSPNVCWSKRFPLHPRRFSQKSIWPVGTFVSGNG